MISAITPLNNSYNRVSFGIIRPKRRPMSEYTYNMNRAFDYKAASKELTEKYSRYPIAIKGIVLLLPEYFEGKMDSKTLAKNCLDRTPVLLTKIAMSDNTKEFQHTYSREISLIKSLNDMCNTYNYGGMTKENFDNFMEIHAQSFLKTDDKKFHRFLD